jgi:hypothetical protein
MFPAGRSSLLPSQQDRLFSREAIFTNDHGIKKKKLIKDDFDSLHLSALLN